MKRFLLALLVACSRPQAPAVSVAAPPEHEPARTSGTLLADCQIVGHGERRREGEPVPFQIFASHDAREAAFVIANPAAIDVTWSHFPVRANDDRARVVLGRFSHVRYDGWAGLYGRAFWTTRRMESVPGHLWVHAGAPIEMMSSSNGTVFARATTPFAAPKTIVVQGNCADVRYDPDQPPRPARHAGQTTVVNADKKFQLFASSLEGHPFTTIDVGAPRIFTFDVLGRSSDFVHVAADVEDVAFDAWIPASQVVDAAAQEVVRPPYMIAPETYDVSRLRRARVTRDAPLFVGFTPEELRGAVIEGGVLVDYDPRTEVNVDGHAIVSFSFSDRQIVAPESGSLWIAKDALAEGTR